MKMFFLLSGLTLSAPLTFSVFSPLQADPKTVVTLATANASVPGAPSVKVLTDKSQYVVGENVRVTFRNDSDLPVLMWLEDGPTKFSIRRSDKAPVVYSPQGQYARQRKNPAQFTVAPHSTSSEVVLLTHLYNIGKPGHYKANCKINYFTWNDNSKSATGSLQSNEIAFKFDSA